MPFAQQVLLRGTQVLAKWFRYWRSTLYFLVQIDSNYIIDRSEAGAHRKRINVGRKESEVLPIPSPIENLGEELNEDRAHDSLVSKVPRLHLPES